MRIFLFSVSLWLIGLSSGHAQWVQTDGPYGATSAAVIFQHDSLLFSATGCGYFSKTALADEWELHSILTFTSYTVVGDSLFAGTLNDGIKLILLSGLNIPPTSINSLIANALSHSDSCLYAGNKRFGFFRSRNGGVTWDTCNNGLPVDTLWDPYGNFSVETFVSCIAVTSDHIYCGTKKGIYRNTGSLGLWQAVNTGLPLVPFNFISEVDNELFAVTGNSIFKWNSGGNSWTLYYTAPSDVTSMLRWNNQLFITTAEDGILFTTDHGLTWYSMNNGLPDLGLNTIALCDTTLLCGTRTKGIFMYDGNQWISDNAGMICSSIRWMTATSGNVFSNDGDSIHLLKDKKWININPPGQSGLPGQSGIFIGLEQMNDTLFLCLGKMISNWPFVRQSIFYSPDTGNTWNEITPLPYTTPAGDSWHELRIGHHRLYGFSSDRVFYTDNLGATWTDVSLPSTYCNHLNDMIIVGSIPFAATCGSAQVIKLTPGQGWVLSNNGLPANRAPLKLAICDGALFADVEYMGMYASLDEGATWNLANNGLVKGYSIGAYAGTGSTLFVTTRDHGVYVTHNAGQDWFECNEGLINTSTGGLAILHDTLYAGTYGNGIWKRAISDITVSTGKTRLSDCKITLYPNPATNHFQVSGEVSGIRIYDMTGREVRSGKPGPGNTFDITGLKNGIYCVGINSDNGLIFRKLIVHL